MAQRADTLWDMIRGAIGGNEEQSQIPQQQSIPYDDGTTFSSNQIIPPRQAAPSLSQIPESARQTVDMSQPPVVENMDYMGDFAPTAWDMASTPNNTTGEEYVAPEEEQGFMSKMGDGIGDFFNDEEKMARLTIGLNSMRLTPDASLAKAMESRISSLRKNKTSNKTAEQLRKMGRNDLADAVENGSLDGKSAWALAFKAPSAFQEKLDLYNKDPEEFAKLKDAGVLGGASTTVNVGGDKMTPGWKKIDERFADDYIKWTGGAAADTAGNIAKLEDVLGKLESGEKLTGPIMGQMPDFIMAFIDPDAVGSREAVEGVVQRNLKAVLGAQFTEKEGEKLIKRAYNPTLGGAENARRLRVLTKQMNSALQSKNQMTQYFRENGTLMGYNGRIPQINDFWAALEGLKVGQKVGNKTYLGGDPKLSSSYK